MRHRTLPAVLAMTFVLSTAALAADLDGVHLSNTLVVDHTTLRLNGIGLRTKYFFKIYVGGLYLARPNSNAAEIIAAHTPKALVMRFVRNVSHSQMAEAYREAFVRNAPALMARQKAAVDRFLAFLPDMKNGERLVFTYDPGSGSTFDAGQSRTLTIPGKAFADLYLQVFIGPHPPTVRLKDELLGTEGS
ncbi:MAG: chalcone isomerase family protein [Gammaproteobacteria bacterium]|nr:chalcone isomerase family protein [Gammaproteobacteria bacterium]